MPRIGSIGGLAIYMHYEDHAPPHCHVRTAGGEREGRVTIDATRMLPASTLNAREERAAIAWVTENVDVVRAAWARINPEVPL